MATIGRVIHLALPLGLALVASVSWGGPPTAELRRDGSRFTLANVRVERVIETHPFLRTVSLGNNMSAPPRHRMIDSREFLLALDGEVLKLTGADFAVGEPEIKWEAGESQLQVPLHCKEHGVDVIVTYRLAGDEFYLRKQLKIDPGEHLLDWVDVELFRFSEHIPLQRFDQQPMPFPMVPWNIMLGRPLFAGNEMFLGVEHPASINSFDQQHWVFLRQHPGRRGIVTTSPAVIGFCPDQPRQRLLDYFEQYVDRNRAHPLRRSIQWVTYFNVQMDDAACREKIAVAERVFRRRDAPLDLVLMDSGWTDPKSIMQISPQRPDRLVLIKKLVKEHLGAQLGLHVITSGVKRSVDKDWLAAEGYDMIYHKSRRDGAYCFADPRVLAEFRGNLVGYVEKFGIASYKFDWGHFACGRTGHRGHLPGEQYGIEAGASNFIRVHQVLRQANPDIFLFNTGWYSPWWLWTYDSVFTAGADYNFGLHGPPSYTTASLLCTWRDATIRGNIVRWSPFFPINSLMTVDPISYWWHAWDVQSESPLRPFTDYFVTACLRGTQLTEIYNNIAAWSDAHAEAVAAVLKWIKANDEVILASTRYIGGDPLAGEPYGYAHFTNNNRGIVLVRNPTVEPRTMEVVFDERAGMWPIDKGYVVRIVYPFTEVLPEVVRYGSTYQQELVGHEVRVLEVWPMDALPEPMPIGCRYQVVERTASTTTFRLSGAVDAINFFSPIALVGSALVHGHLHRLVLRHSEPTADKSEDGPGLIEASGRKEEEGYSLAVNLPADTWGRASLVFTAPKITGEMTLDGKVVEPEVPHLRLPDAAGRERVGVGMKAAASRWSLFGVELSPGEHALRFHSASLPDKEPLWIVDAHKSISSQQTVTVEHAAVSRGCEPVLPQNRAWEEHRTSVIPYVKKGCLSRKSS